MNPLPFFSNCLQLYIPKEPEEAPLHIHDVFSCLPPVS